MHVGVINLNIESISKIVNGEIIKNTNKLVNKIKIDSRKIETNDLFIALIGNNIDSHKFIKQIHKKISVAIICKAIDIKHYDCGIIKVKDTYDAMNKLAAFYRNLYKVPLIAITGSVGKTTTKELISNMLEKKYNVLKTYKNYNNHIGLPLTLFNLDKNIDIIVTEMGMNHKGELHNLSLIAKPDVSVITNIGSSHIGNLGSKKNILLAKLEILDGMKTKELFVNGYDKNLKKIKISKKIKRKNKNFKVKKVKYNLDSTTFDFIYKTKKYNVKFNVPGKGMLNNLLISIAVALKFDVDINDIVEVINNYHNKNDRLEIIKNNNFTIINDCYNASFESFKMILKTIKKSKQNKIIVFGDIKELGRYSKYYHKKIARMLNKIKTKIVILVGSETYLVKKYIKNSIHFNNNLEIINYLNKINLDNHLILVKGSRAMNLEKIVENLKKS